MRGVFLAVVLVAAGPQVGRAQVATSPPLSLSAALAKAREANPTILAARRAKGAGEANVRLAGERPNPEVSFEAEKETPHQALAVSLPIELGGKRTRRIDVANAGLAVIDADIARTIADVENQVRRAYFALAAANAQRRLADDLRGLSNRARDAAAARVAAGDAPRLEGVQTELALADAENEVARADGEVVAGRIELNTLLGAPVNDPVVVDDALGAGAIPQLSDVLTTARASNVDLVALDRRIGEQTARRDLARSLQTPDITVGSSLTYDAQPEFSYGWRASAGITLPLFTRHRAAIAVEDGELSRLMAERDATLSTLMGAVSAAFVRLSSTRDQWARFEQQILPRALEVETMAQDGYRSGQTGVTALLQVLASTRDVRSRGLQAALDVEMALAELERVAGVPLR